MSVPPFLDVFRTEPHVATDFHVSDAAFSHEAADHAFGDCQTPGGLGCSP